MATSEQPDIFSHFNHNHDNDRLAKALIGITGKQFDELVPDFEKAHAEIQGAAESPNHSPV